MLLGAQLHVVAIALLVAMLALEGRGIASDHAGVAVGNQLEVSNRHDVLHGANVIDLAADQSLAARAVRLEVQRDLHLLRSQSLLARSGLLTLVRVAHHIEEVVLLAHHLAVHDHPRHPLVGGSLVRSLQMKQRTLRALRALQNGGRVNSSLLRTSSHALVREVHRGLLAQDHLPGLLVAEVLLGAQLHVVTIAFLVAMLALEGRGIASDHVSITVRNQLQIGDRHHVLHGAELHQIAGDELLAAGAVGLVVQGSLHLLRSQSLLARSGLLTLVRVAHSLNEVGALIQDLAVHNHPGDPLVIAGLVRSLQVQQRTLRALRAAQNHVVVHAGLHGASHHAVVGEVHRGLLANEEVPPGVRVVLLSAQLHVVAVALLLAVLALESGRIAGDHVSVAVGNNINIGNGHQIRKLAELHKILRHEVLAVGAVRFDVKGDLHILGLQVTIQLG